MIIRWYLLCLDWKLIVFNCSVTLYICKTLYIISFICNRSNWGIHSNTHSYPTLLDSCDWILFLKLWHSKWLWAFLFLPLLFFSQLSSREGSKEIGIISISSLTESAVSFSPIFFTFSSWMRRYWFYVKNEFRNFHQIFTFWDPLTQKNWFLRKCLFVCL